MSIQTATHPPTKPDPAALQLLAQSWARSATGVWYGSDGAVSRLIEGRAASPADQQRIIDDVYRGGGRFEPILMQPGGRQKQGAELAIDLLEMGRRLGLSLDRALMRRAVVVNTRYTTAAFRFPLPEELRTFFSQRPLVVRSRPHLQLGPLLEQLALPPERTLPGLAVLHALGLLRLRGMDEGEELSGIVGPGELDPSASITPVPAAPPQQLEDVAGGQVPSGLSSSSGEFPSRSGPIPSPVGSGSSGSNPALKEELPPVPDAPPPANEREARQVRRMQREWALVQSQDVWALVGLAPGFDRAQLRAAQQRLQTRHRRLDPRRLPASCQPLAEKILERERAALMRLRRGRSLEGGAALGPRPPAFAEGVRLLSRRRFKEAVRWLQHADRQRPGDPSIMSQLGWALVHAAPDEEAMQRGEKLIRSALEKDPENREAPFFLAWLLAQRRQTAEARALLEENLARHPGHAPSRLLLIRVRSSS